MRIAVVLILASSAALARAQEVESPPAPEATSKPQAHSGAPLLQFRVGPIVVTPTIKIGTLGVDTNVRYTRARSADFVASAGPGLDVALPFLDHWKLNVESSAQYFYFHRTKELRRWTGQGTGNLFWETTGTRARVSVGVNREFARPSFEVDTRVARTLKTVEAQAERDLGRLTLVARSSYAKIRADAGQDFRGADLSAALSMDLFRGNLELQYRVTPLSALLVEGGYEETHFPAALPRNFAQENVGAGLRTAGFFKGQITAGIRRTHLLEEFATKTQPYLRGNLAQELGRRFRLAERYTHDSNVSAFAVNGTLPTFENRSLDIDLSIEFTKRMDLRLGGTRTRLSTDGVVQVDLDSGRTVTARRDDLIYVGRADLGIRLGRARTAVFVSYTTRDSQFFSDFGIQGLQAGARVEYAPR